MKGSLTGITCSWNGHEAVVKSLLDTDSINLDFAHNDGSTAICLAAQAKERNKAKARPLSTIM
jgi:hypothetical protein